MLIPSAGGSPFGIEVVDVPPPFVNDGDEDDEVVARFGANDVTIMMPR